MGLHQLKGISDEIEVFKVIKPSGKKSRLDVFPEHELSPFVGRDREMGIIYSHWQTAKTGKGKAVLIKGDAGIGKSRLVHQLKQRLDLSSSHVLEIQTSPLTQSSTLHPLIELLKSQLLTQHIQGDARIWSTLRNFLNSHHLDNPEHRTVLSDLLGISSPETERPQFSAAKQRQIALEIITRFVVGYAERAPVLLVFEDLHWADNSTLEWLALFMEQLQGNRIFSILTTRPLTEYPDWIAENHVLHIPLGQLSEENIQSICAFKCNGKRLPASVFSSIVQKTDGIPLFVEELTANILESGMLRAAGAKLEFADSQKTLTIPSSLHDSLMSRLDRLPAGKELAQTGSVLGRAFSYDLLQAVSGLNHDEIDDSLQKLTHYGILFEKEIGEEPGFIFKHALVQDAAYKSLMKSQRQRLHKKVAGVMEEAYPALANAQPELVAHHLTEGNLVEEAIPKWMQAGQKAMQKNANMEAVVHLEKALALSEGLPGPSRKVESEIQMLMMLGGLYTSTRSFAGPEVENCYRKAFELSQRSGNAANLFYVNCGLLGHATFSGNFPKAVTISKTLFDIAHETGDPTFWYVANSQSGMVNTCLGNYPDARKQLERSFNLYDPDKHDFLTMLGYGHIKNIGLTWYEWVLSITGYLDQAVKVNQEIRSRTARLHHVQTTFADYCNSSVICSARKDTQKLLEIVDVGYPLAVETQELFVIPFLKFFYGYAHGLIGDHEKIAMAYEGFAGQEAIGNQFAATFMRVFLAELIFDTGRIEEGYKLLQEAAQIIERMGGACFIREEVPRIEGRYLQHMGQLAEAEKCFQKAIAISRSKGSKLFELRAANQLARLWQEQGKGSEAVNLVSKLYAWFPEGLDEAVDLLEARAIINELS